jgi:hypothetical protein
LGGLVEWFGAVAISKRSKTMRLISSCLNSLLMISEISGLLADPPRASGIAALRIHRRERRDPMRQPPRPFLGAMPSAGSTVMFVVWWDRPGVLSSIGTAGESRSYQDATAREVGRFGGRGEIHGRWGAGVLRLPRAKNDAVGAIYASLAVVRAVKHLGGRMLAKR